MLGCYSSLAVANWLLDRFDDEKRPCTQLQINKLVFIAHGWHLGAYPDLTVGLIDEPVFAWRLGPVIPTIRQEFRDFGSSPITRRATTWIDNFEIYTPAIEPEHYDSLFLKWIWKNYGHLDGVALMQLTHKEGSPWSTVTKNGTDIGHNKIIPDETIQVYYRGLFEHAIRQRDQH